MHRCTGLSVSLLPSTLTMGAEPSLVVDVLAAFDLPTDAPGWPGHQATPITGWVVPQ